MPCMENSKFFKSFYDIVQILYQFQNKICLNLGMWLCAMKMNIFSPRLVCFRTIFIGVHVLVTVNFFSVTYIEIRKID